MRFLMTTHPSDTPPTPAQMAAIGQLTVEMMQSGKLLDTGGIQFHGSEVKYHDGEFTVTDGPFAEAKELIAGFAIVNAESREEAFALSKRFFEAAGNGTGEVRQLFSPDDFQPPSA